MYHGWILRCPDLRGTMLANKLAGLKLLKTVCGIRRYWKLILRHRPLDEAGLFPDWTPIFVPQKNGCQLHQSQTNQGKTVPFLFSRTLFPNIWPKVRRYQWATFNFKVRMVHALKCYSGAWIICSDSSGGIGTNQQGKPLCKYAMHPLYSTYNMYFSAASIHHM